MTTYKVLVILGIPLALIQGAPPLKVAIDCGLQDTSRQPKIVKQTEILPRRDIENLCSIIHNALPKSIQDGKFILIGEPKDQSRASNSFVPVTVPPPKGFLPVTVKPPKGLVPKFKVPKLKVPKFNVPVLKAAGPLSAPRIGTPMRFPLRSRNSYDEESSAERMEKFKKGVQKMLHVVKVLGQIDQYVSERTRIIVDILSKTFSEPHPQNN